MTRKLTFLAILLLASMNVLTFIYSTQTSSQLAEYKKSVDENTNKIVYVEAKDGYTPVKGIDYFDGAAGINAMSYTVTNTVVQERQLIGPIGPKGDSPACLLEESKCQGKDGLDAPIQHSRVNPDTKDVETRLDNERGWKILYTCQEYRNECPGE